MGNFPLCIPKQDAIVFRDGPNSSNDFLLRHRFQIDDLDSLRNEQRHGGPECSNDPQGVDDTAVLGIELDQDSVRICTTVCTINVDMDLPPPPPPKIVKLVHEYTHWDSYNPYQLPIGHMAMCVFFPQCINHVLVNIS